MLGHRVLLVDADPQGSLTQGLWGRNRLKSMTHNESIFSVFNGDSFHAEVIHQTNFENLWLLPSHRDARHWNRLPEFQWVDHEYALRDLIRQVQWDFDYILCDTPPNLELLTHATLMASEWVIVPVQLENYGAHGLDEVNESIDRVRSLREDDLRIMGYLPTMYNKQLGLHRTFRATLHKLYGDLMFETTIPRSNDFPTAISSRVCVSHLKKKKGVAHESIAALAREIESRVGVTQNG